MAERRPEDLEELVDAAVRRAFREATGYEPHSLEFRDLIQWFRSFKNETEQRAKNRRAGFLWFAALIGTTLISTWLTRLDTFIVRIFSVFSP